MSTDPAALSGVPATMLITVAARTLAPRQRPDLDFRDPFAERIIAALGVDPGQLCTGEPLLVATAVRSRIFDAIARAFFHQHPRGRAISLGCGLGTNFDRLAAAVGIDAEWVDVDLPDIIAIRRRFFEEEPRRRMHTADVRDAAWFAELLCDDRPALILAEGLLYYLSATEVEALFRRLAAAADARRSPLEIAFDFASVAGVELSNRLNVDVNRSGARFQWGLDGTDDLLAWDPKLEVVAMAGWRDELPDPYREIFTSMERRDGLLPSATLHLRRRL